MGAVFGAVATGGLAYMIKGQLDAIDSISKLSDELAISTEALVGYQHQAALTGTSNTTLNKGLQRLVRRLGEARQGYGEGRKALEALGLEAETVANMGVENAFETVVEQIRQMPTATERAAAAYALFGRQGQELMNFILGGAEGMRKAREEAEQLGIAFSRLDGAKVEAANDALHRAGQLMTGLLRQAAIQLAPYIEAVGTAIFEWGTSGEGAGQKVVRWVGHAVKAAGLLVDVWNVLAGAAKTFGMTVTWAVTTALKWLGKLGEGVGMIVDVFTFGLLGIQEKAEAMTNVMSDSAESAWQGAAEGWKQMMSGFEGKASSAFKKQLGMIDRAAQKAAEASTSSRESTQGLTKDVDALAAAANQDMKQGVVGLNKELEEAQRRTQSLLDRFVEWEEEQSAIVQKDKARLGDLYDLWRELMDANLQDEAKIVEERAKELAVMEAVAGASEAAAEAVQEQVDAQEKAAAAAADLNRDLDERLRLAKAATDLDRDKIRLEMQYGDLVKQAKGDEEAIAKIKELHQIELNQLLDEAAKAAEDRARTELATTNTMKEQAAAQAQMAQEAKKHLDITQKFANFGGKSVFGFGKGLAGTGLGNIFGSVNVRTRPFKGHSRPTKSASAPAAAAAQAVAPIASAIDAGTEKMSDLAPAIDAVRSAWEGVVSLWDKLDAGIEGFKKSVTTGVDAMAGNVERAVDSLAKGQSELRARVNANERRLQAAAATGLR